MYIRNSMSELVSSWHVERDSYFEWWTFLYCI